MRKLRLISKFMTSLSGRQVVTIHISPITSGSKSNETNFVSKIWSVNRTQHEKYFLEKSQNLVEKLVPDLFLQKPRFSISLDQQSEIL